MGFPEEQKLFQQLLFVVILLATNIRIIDIELTQTKHIGSVIDTDCDRNHLLRRITDLRESIFASSFNIDIRNYDVANVIRKILRKFCGDVLVNKVCLAIDLKANDILVFVDELTAFVHATGLDRFQTNSIECSPLSLVLGRNKQSRVKGDCPLNPNSVFHPSVEDLRSVALNACVE